jgi:hypothetical protein
MSYASVLFPPIREAEVGPFRFPIYEALLPGENTAFHALNMKQTQGSYKSIKLAQKIAKDLKITTKEALEKLSEGQDPANEELLYNYVEELSEMQNNTISEEAKQEAYVFAFIQQRGEFFMPGTKEPIPGSKWTEADMKRTPQTLINAIYQLVLCERDGWPTPEGEDEGNDSEA